ncbi:MAG: hypothetical protein QNK03_28490 [Myxococcota bacterium]|nr:hypothetical protein [Myxococcota bacterium]
MRTVFSLAALVLATLLLLELATRAFHALPGETPPHADLSLQHEWQWAARHLAAEKPLLPGGHTYHARLGWSMKPNLRLPLLRTNSVGMRAEREFAEARTPGVSRVVLVGDSYTMGATVGDEDSWHSVLARDFLPGWEVLNLGVSGYAVDQAVLRYELLGSRYRPDVVVLGFYVRDHYRNLSSFRGYAKPRFRLGPDGALTLHDAHLMPPEALYEAYRSGRRRAGGWSYSYALAVAAQAWELSVARRRVERGDADWQLTAAILERFRDRVEADGATPVLLIIPTRPKRYHGWVYEQIDLLAREEARRLGMLAVALADSFHAEPDAAREEPLFRPREQGGHLTEAGNREMARLLARALAEAGLADARSAAASD